MDGRLVTPYINSTTTIITEMSGIKITELDPPVSERSDHISKGVGSVITFVGKKIKGRFVLDFEPELAQQVIAALLGEEQPSLRDRTMLGCIAELNNIIAGDANTWLNNQFELGLRLAPPLVFTGENLILATSRLNSVTVTGQTVYGDLKMNIAFEGGLPA
jgi:chemotaxis protein CheX